jgi:hypothetical protein
LNEKSAKVYYTSTIDAWCEYILSQPVKERNSYFLITGQPIIGYMDLEFSKELNPKHSAESMIDILFVHFKKVWQTYYPDLEELKDENFLILTASNEKKESFHVHGPFNYAFKNQHHFCVFLHLVNRSIKNDEKSNEFMVKVPIGPIISFIDLNTYVHHSSLRMFSCSKINQNRPMMLSEKNKFPLSYPEDEKEIFKMSMMHYIPKDAEIIEFPDEKLRIKILPKIFKEEKIITTEDYLNLLSEFEKCKFENCSHFNLFHEKEDFVLIRDIDSFYLKVSKNLKSSFVLQEKLSEETLFILEIHERKIEKNNSFFMNVLQSVVNTYFNSKEECFLFNVPSGVRLIFPNLKVKKNEGSEILNKISILLSKEIPKFDWKKLILDVYSLGYISMLGSEKFQNKVSKVQFRGAFDGDSKRMEIKNILEIMKKVSVNLREK